MKSSQSYPLISLCYTGKPLLSFVGFHDHKNSICVYVCFYMCGNAHPHLGKRSEHVTLGMLMDKNVRCFNKQGHQSLYVRAHCP